jgi:hypothetical protein
MRKLLPVLAACMMLCSCGPYIYPLKGKYPTDGTAIVKIPADKKDELWGRIMTFFSANNIPIKTVDKGAGYIKSDKMNWLRYAWGEEIKHSRIDSSGKYIVVERFSPERGDYPIFPFITGAILIYTINDGGHITVKVSIADLSANDIRVYRQPAYRYSSQSYFEIHSLGKLESKLASYITGADTTMPILNMKVDLPK